MGIWIIWNILLDFNGLTVEMKNLDHVQKILIAIFFFVANTSVYIVLAKFSQLAKRKDEARIKEELLYTHT